MSKTATTLTQMRDLPDSELSDRLAQTRDELFRLHLGMHTNQVTSSAELANKRKAIARIQTILSGRKLGIEKQAQKEAATPATTESTEKPAAKAKKAKKS